MKILRTFLFVMLSLFPVSCGKQLLPALSHPSSARLILYMHTASSSPPDIVFTISKIELESEDGSWIELMEGQEEISSHLLLDSQVLLKEVAVDPGLYKAIKVSISSASIMRKSGYVNLALPQPDGETLINLNLRLEEKESSVVSLEWDPEESVVGGYRLQPDVKAEFQVPSAKGLLLFVSNAASNYISIIDRSLERVIGAITVGEGPMGMALNPSQDRLYVVNSASGSISVIDVTHFNIFETVHLTAGIGPTDIVFMPEMDGSEGKLYVVNRISNNVTVVDTSTSRVLKTIVVETSPSAIAVDASRREVYVTNERSNTLSIINTIDDSLVMSLTVGNRPTGLVVRKDKDMIYVFNEGSNDISIVSPSLREITGTISVSDPPKGGMEGFGGRLFVANRLTNTVAFLNVFDVVTRSVPVGIGPTGLAGDEMRNRLYITNYGDNTVSLLDPIGEQVLKKLFVGENPYGVVLFEK